MGLALALAEAEDDDRLVMLLHDHFDNFKHVRGIVLGPFGSRAIIKKRKKEKRLSSKKGKVNECMKKMTSNKCFLNIYFQDGELFFAVRSWAPR